MPSKKRSLDQCAQARCLLDNIYCAKGHKLGGREDGKIPDTRLQRGDPLEFTQCQGCEDFDYEGEKIPKEERGWLLTK